MLKEAKHVMQITGEPRRRWFDDEDFDLIVWFEPAEEIMGFQLCYDREKKPRALTWTKKHGYKHTGIDNGEHIWGAAKSSPVLIEDGLFDAPSISAKFERDAAEIPHGIAAFVLEKLKAFKL